MSFLQKLVSGSRRRYTDEAFNIDLTYICPQRIIVMSFPASGIQSQWRNSYKDIQKFLNERHGNKYWIFNVSERTYDKERFDNRVSNYNWPDHYAPPFHLITELANEMYNWLKQDSENVVVIHCNSGKGRAGTACTCLLLYIGLFDTIQDCARLFSHRRFTDGKGLSQPCQVRFVNYFEAFYKGIVVSPQAKFLRAIEIESVPNANGTGITGSPGCFPYFQVLLWNGMETTLLYENRNNKDQCRFYSKLEGSISFKIEERLLLVGSILISIKNKGTIQNYELFRVTFNTAFIGKSNKLVCHRKLISPEHLHKDYAKFDENFKISFTFEDFCKGSTSRPSCQSNLTPIDDLCNDCQTTMKEEIDVWRKAKAILKKHDFPEVKSTRERLIPNMDEIIGKAGSQVLKWEPCDYKVQEKMFHDAESQPRGGSSEETKVDSNGVAMNHRGTVRKGAIILNGNYAEEAKQQWYQKCEDEKEEDDQEAFEAVISPGLSKQQQAAESQATSEPQPASSSGQPIAGSDGGDRPPPKGDQAADTDFVDNQDKEIDATRQMLNELVM